MPFLSIGFTWTWDSLCNQEWGWTVETDTAASSMTNQLKCVCFGPVFRLKAASAGCLLSLGTG